MSTRLKLLRAVLRKDLQLFWPLAVLTAVLILLSNINAIMARDAVTEGVLATATTLAAGLLILLVFHEDSAISGKCDWLTRPVPGMTVLAAKILLIALAVLLPDMLGHVLNRLHLGRPVVEVLVTSVADSLSGAALLAFLCMLVFAALTSGIRQAVIAAVTLFVLLLVASAYDGILVFPPANWIADRIGRGVGSAWMLTRTMELLVAFTALAVLWGLYRRRLGRRAALVIIGAAALAGGGLLATMTRSRMYSVQKWLSPEPAAASSVSVSLLPGCFLKTKVFADLFPYPQQMRAGDDAVAFAVRLAVDRLPEGEQLIVSRAQLTYRMADGATVSLGAGRNRQPWDQQWVKAESGQRAIDQFWLLPRADYQRLAADPGVVAHLDYSLSLLQPAAEAMFAADGVRAFRAGIGYCSAAPNSAKSALLVDCYRVGDQPALLAVRAEGQPVIEDRTSGNPDFTPAVLDFWGGRRHRMYVMDAAAPQVRVTAYEARVHFTRQFDVPGVLGGPVSSCPLP